MDYEKRLKHYEDRYKQEIDLRDKIESRANSRLSIFAIVFTILAYLCNATILDGKLYFNASFWTVLIIAAVSFAVSIYYFIRAIYGYVYLLIPTPEDLEKYFEENLKTNEKVSPGDAQKWARESFEEYLYSCYIKYSSHNTKNNDAKSLNLEYNLRALIFSFLMGCIAFIPYIAGVNEHKEKQRAPKTAATATASSTSNKGSTTSTSSIAYTSSSSSRGAATVK